MVLFPREGRVYWHVTDYWETFYAIPLKRTQGAYELDLGDGYCEVFNVPRLRLYKTKRQAAHVAKKLNKGQRNEAC